MSISTDHSKLEENSLDKESATKFSFPGICCAGIIIFLSIHHSQQVLDNEIREGRFNTSHFVDVSNSGGIIKFQSYMNVPQIGHKGL